MRYPGRIAGLDDRLGVYSIGAVGRMLGLERATIRNWEERYGLIRPQRSPGGHRLFSREDVERLRFLAERVEAGDTPAQAHQHLKAHLDHGRPLTLPDGPAVPSPVLLVLLAERDPLAAQLTEYFLRTEGYDVAVCLDPAGVIPRYHELHPQVAVVDLLVGGSGLALCQELKTHGLPVLVAVSSLRTVEAAMAAGADAFLTKPLEPLQLVSTVRDLLGTSALARPRPVGL